MRQPKKLRNKLIQMKFETKKTPEISKTNWLIFT